MRFVIYKGKEWRWRLVARNGRIIADGGEGYTRRSSCIEAVYRVRRHAGTARVEFGIK